MNDRWARDNCVGGIPTDWQTHIPLTLSLSCRRDRGPSVSQSQEILACLYKMIGGISRWYSWRTITHNVIPIAILLESTVWRIWRQWKHDWPTSNLNNSNPHPSCDNDNNNNHRQLYQPISLLHSQLCNHTSLGEEEQVYKPDQRSPRTQRLSPSMYH